MSVSTTTRLAPPETPRNRLRDLNFYQVLFFAYVAVSLVAFIFLVPPFQKSDEPAHYHRAVSLTNLDLVCAREGDDSFFPMERRYANLPEVIRTWDVAFDYNRKFDPAWLRVDFSDPVFDEVVRIHRFCSLLPLGYLPNTLGVLIGKPLENPLPGFYLGRIFGALFFLGAVVLSLKVAPQRYHLLIYFYAAIPTVLHQVSAISYDVVQLSLFPLILAYILRFNTDAKRVRTIDLLILMGLLWWTANVRLYAYVPLVLLYFLVRPRLITPEPGRYLAITSAFMGGVAFTVLLFSALYLGAVEDSAPVEVNINAREQVRLVFNEPRTFLSATYNTIDRWGEGIMRETIGVFGWIDYTFTYIPYYIAVGAAAMLVAYMTWRDTVMLRPWQLIALAGAIVGTAGMLFLSLYAVWSPVGHEIVYGLQGRYFVGLFPLTVLLISQTAAVMGKERFLKVAALGLALFFAYSIVSAILKRYYE